MLANLADGIASEPSLFASPMRFSQSALLSYSSITLCGLPLRLVTKILYLYRSSNNPQSQTKILWKSTEHNIDVYVAFTRLYEATGEKVWKDRALHAKTFVKAMWDETEGHLNSISLHPQDSQTLPKTLSRSVIIAEVMTFLRYMVLAR